MSGSPDDGTFVNPEGMTEAQVALAHAIHEIDAVRFGEFTLKSGIVSPVYVDLRRLQRHPEEGGAKQAAVDAYIGLVEPIRPDLIAPVPTAASPYASSVSDRMGIPMVTPRVDKKDHGSGATVDGIRPEDVGRRVALIDDLVTKADSKVEAAGVLRAAGLTVEDVVVLLDREQGAEAMLAEHGLNLHAALKFKPMLAYYRRMGMITEAQYDQVMTFLQS